MKNYFKIDFSKKSTQFITLCFLALIWGSSFILMKKGLITYSPVEITLYRIFIVFLFFTPFGIKGITKINFKIGFVLFISAFIGSAIPYFLFIKAQQSIDSSLNGILNSITPLFTLVFAVAFFKEKANLKAVLGIIIGLMGAAGLIFVSNGKVSVSNTSIYALLPLIGSACYALNVNLIKNFLHEMSATKITSLSFLFIGPIAGVYLFFYTDFFNHLINHEKFNDPYLTNFLFINILGIIGTGLAVWVFNLLIKETSSVFASSVTYLIPIVAIFWGVNDGESFGIYQGLLCGIILAGVYLIKSNKNT